MQLCRGSLLIIALHGAISLKLMCISLYDVNSSSWTGKHYKVLTDQTEVMVEPRRIELLTS